MKSYLGKLIFAGLLMICFFDCSSESKLEKEIAAIEVDLVVERFDRLFGNSSAADLPRLKAAYPFMFSSSYSDQDWINRMNDSLQKQLHAEVNSEFSDFPEEEDIADLFRHLKYHYKEFSVPRVITVTSDVDYRNKTIVTDTISLIALDTYLGADHEFYGGIQEYIKQGFEREMILSDLCGAYAEKYIYRSPSKTFLEDMIYYGKLLYFKDMMIPKTSDALKIGYSVDQLEWAIANESNIWRYFIENELLYKTDAKLAGRFINPAPFSKFNLELDRESPGRLGQYIGWQIVRSYMDKNDINFKELFIKSGKEIFENSGFKPRK